MAETATKQDKSATTEQTAPAPRKRVESPQAFYQRLITREDVRRLLTKLAKL